MKVIIGILLILTIGMPIAATDVAAFSDEVSYCEFSDTQPVMLERTLSDFAGGEFKLYELENGYAIYKVQDGQEVFIEGSYETHSPYYTIDSEEIYYLGPGNYYFHDGNELKDIMGQTSAEESLEGASYNLLDLPETRASGSNPDPNETKVDANSFTVVKRADYFKKLKWFPENWFGECGLIALSIMLSYYDTFFNDNFIPNNTFYQARYYKQTRAGGSGLELDYTTTEALTKKVTTLYKNTSNYPFETWSNMPGTTYAMRDYLFDNYMHTFLGIGWDSQGYPMLNGELKDTLLDYMTANCSSLKNSIEIRHGSLFYTHQRPTDYINEGLPTCLVLQKYDSTVGAGKAHVVVAYGHKDGKFLTHFGWWPGSTSGAQVVLNSATIYGYFTFKYNGGHVHSQNVTMKSGSNQFGICGCGYVTAI